MPAPDADTELLTASLRAAGPIARKFFGGTYKSWDKSRGNPVTEADIEIDRFLKAALLAARPDYGWLSEETEDNSARLSREAIFVVDPIDGTIGFIRGRPHFTIVAAVVTKGRPVAAAIYNPIEDEMFEATLGEGARLNGAPIHVSTRDTFEGAQLLAERALFEPSRWKEPWPSSLTVETRASVAYRMALVAAARFDAMISLSSKYEWDLAAGDLICCEAGARVTTQTGETLRYNKEKPVQGSVVAAGPALHARLLARLAEIAPAPRA